MYVFTEIMNFIMLILFENSKKSKSVELNYKKENYHFFRN